MSKNNRVPLGVLATGETVSLDLSSPSHVAIQGMTRSGKSASAYALIASLVARGAVVDVVDPTSVLGAPLVASGAASASCLGTGEPEQAVSVVEGLLELMRERVAGLWADRVDKRTVWTDDYPLRVLVVEELPGVVEWLQDNDAAEGRKSGERLAPAFVAGLRQLLAQGLKVGVLVVLLAQRFDASILSGPARSNIGVRVCLRVDDGDAVRMLIPGADVEIVETLATVRPGRGLATTPEFRGQKVALRHLDYADYLHKLGVIRGTKSP